MQVEWDMRNMRAIRICLLPVIFLSGAAHAQLQGRLPFTPGGTDYQAYYDETLDITWAADAGGIFRNWDDANEVISRVVIDGVRGWRLPSMDVNMDGTVVECDEVTEADCRDNELGYMYYYNLGGIITDDDLSGDQPPFVNIRNTHWSGTEGPSSDTAYIFGFVFGNQLPSPKSGSRGVWVVRSGDVAAFDSDGDGFTDDVDNCSLTANPDQTDTDSDQIGNVCDADLNNDCVVNAADLGLLRSRFFTTDPDADFNVDGIVNVGDLGIMRAAFFTEPGPSASELCNNCESNPWIGFVEGLAGTPGDGSIVDSKGGIFSTSFEFDTQPAIPTDADGVTITVYPVAGLPLPTRILPVWKVAGTNIEDGCRVGIITTQNVALAPAVNGVTGYTVLYTRPDLLTIADLLSSPGPCGDVGVGDLALAYASVFSGEFLQGTNERVTQIDAIAVNIGKFEFPCSDATTTAR
ncbi:MAG: thrombospondin type 3 repeat-containing protein [Gammaproteobacteria bacterium]